jgi:hypothetical protein
MDTSRWEPGDPMFARESRAVSGSLRTKPMMNEHGKSDRLVVPEKSSNKAKVTAAEEMEGRSLAKGNSNQQNAFRTQSRADAPSALERVREVARGRSTPTPQVTHASIPEAGAGCGKSARPDLCGGYGVIRIPTATALPLLRSCL